MIVIDPSKGGSDVGVVGNGITEKDFNLLISSYIYDRLNALGADVKIIRTDDETLSNTERANRIINSYGDNNKVVALSNRLSNSGNDVEIIYALRNKDTLSKSIKDNLENNNIKVNKYYQRRSEDDTSKDYNSIQRNTGNIETIIVDYGNVNDLTEANNLKNNYKTYAESVIKALANYQGIPYFLEGEEDVYIVKKGDNLYSIAAKYNTTVSEIKKLNNLTSNLLSVGQQLNIPIIKTQTEGETYIVQKGDNLYSIANKFNTTVDNLKKINNLSSNLLSVGQILKLDETTSDEGIYVVKKGDSLYSIANKYNTTVEELKSLNNLTNNLLSIGQKLKLPNEKTLSGNIYVVQKGDNLYSIANKYNTTVSVLKQLNNLTSNLLSIGQQLQLPDTIIKNDNIYVVQKGDNLYSIANKFNTTVDNIKRINNLNSNLLQIGQQLKISN